MKKNEERLKSYLKGRIKITQSLIVLFFITGGTLYGEVQEKTVKTPKKKEASADFSITAMVGQNQGTVTNLEDGRIESTENDGIYVTGLERTAINKRATENIGDVGMLATDAETTVANILGGTVSKAGVYGMSASGADATATNTGIVTNIGDYGMSAENGGTVSNSGTISNTGIYGMSGSGVDSTVTNTGTVSNTETHGIFVEKGATATNKGTVSNGGDYGMYAKDAISTILNSGTISNTGRFGMYGLGNNARIQNNGIIANTTTYGMSSEGTGVTLINSKGAEIINSGNYGMNVSGAGSTGINNGIISNLGMYGIVVTTATASGQNYGTVSNKGDYGMYSISGGSVVNNAGGIVSNDGNYGIFAGSATSGVKSGSTAINTGTVSNSGDYGIYAQNENTLALNDVGGKVSNIGNYGMYSSDGAEVRNLGSITTAKVAGMTANGAGSLAQNLDTGTITALTGTVNSMQAENGGTAINNSKAALKVGNAVMQATGAGSTAINYSILNPDFVAMRAENGGTVINEVGGLAYANLGGGGRLMEALGTGSTAINRGELKTESTENWIRAMYASGGGTIINEGLITIETNRATAGQISYAMEADGEGSTIRNAGTINLVGGVSTKNNTNITDANGNKAFNITGGATFSNTAIFKVDGDLNSSEMSSDGTGRFELGGGTLEADSIRGDFYISGALAMGKYTDIQDTYRLFKTENMYGNIKSNSAMYDVALRVKDSNGFYGITMSRKDFDDIIDNSELGAYLENNYIKDGATTERGILYDSYKLQTTEERLNRSVNQTFGSTVYPAFAYQTLFNIRGINRDIQSEVLNNSVTEDVRFIGFSKYKDTSVTMGDNVDNYDAKISTATLGIDKAISDTVRVGILGSIGKSYYIFDNNESRKDDVYQANLIGSYEKDGLKATGSLFLGKINGDIKRKLAFGTINSEMTGNLETDYYGVDLGLQKRYEGEIFNITPRVELNVTQISQKSIKEKGTYALDVESKDSTSVEPGVGFSVDKTITTANGVKVTPNARVMYYRDLGNPYKDINATMTSVSQDSFKINGYNVDRDRGEFSIGVRVEKNAIELNVGVEFKVDDQGREVTPFIGVGYRF